MYIWAIKKYINNVLEMGAPEDTMCTIDINRQAKRRKRKKQLFST